VPRLLVHIVTGPENPTRAALGMLVARTALRSGHEVDVFFAGEGVGLLRAATLDAGVGIGTGSLREHYNALVEGGAGLYASGMSAKARDITAEAFEGAPVAMSPPDTLIDLVFAADRVLVY
jgi:predicted peroxiredoxin